MMQPNIFVNDHQNMCQSKHTKMTSVVSVNTISSWKQEICFDLLQNSQGKKINSRH